MLKIIILSLILGFNGVFAQQTKIRKTPILVPQYVQLTQTNTAWKTHVWGGEESQSIMMSITAQNSENNQLGPENLDMDMYIIVASGRSNAIIDGQETTINEGDMLFIPKNYSHTLVNLNDDKPLKLFIITSKFYMPRTTFMTQADENKSKTPIMGFKA